MHPNIVILAAGAGSRMKKSQDVAGPLAAEARTKPKMMIGVGEGGRPLLGYLLANVNAAGYRNVCIVLPEADDRIIDYCSTPDTAKMFPTLKLSYARQSTPPGREKPLGTADAVLQALRTIPWSGQRFTVCNSDNLYSQDALHRLLIDEHDHAMIAYERSALQFSEERIAQFAVIVKDDDGFLEDIIEKPSLSELERSRDALGRIDVSMNLWRFSCDAILPFLESTPLHPDRNEKELPQTVKNLIRAVPKAVFTIPLSEHVVDLTTQADLSVVQEQLRK